MIESDIQQYILVDAPHLNCVLMRNNSGCLKDSNGRLVRYGLMNTSAQQNARIKSSDLIGLTTIVITPDMVGRTIGVFTAVEVKREDWKPSKTCKREESQSNFIEWVKKRGGIAGFANSVDCFRELIKEFNRARK